MPSLQLPPIHRYLWVQGAASPLPPGTLLAGRYQVVQFPLIQDTCPQEPPTQLEAVPSLAEPYLALSAFSVAIPRPFTQVPHPSDQTPLLLLEEVPLHEVAGKGQTPTLLPTLLAVWEKATALHQLTWLWRIAKLWQPCIDNQVAQSLLDWQNLRVDGEDLRLLTLMAKPDSPTLVNLGQHWQALVETAAVPVKDYLSQVIQRLQSGEGNAKGLAYSLIRAIEQLSAKQAVSVEFATASDQGPTRQRNEDACFPSSGFSEQRSVTPTMVDTVPAPLVVVCDGVGGHQGGDVASRSAIAEVTQQLKHLTRTPNLSHVDIVASLKQAIFAANQVISARNDADQRQDRDRMGTTIVIALVYGTRLYVAHLGDSRAYRVRPYSCRQITLDDDVAVREMRLGLELYQDALQNPGSGALVQALGMAKAEHLHPTVKLYPIATDSLIVLCSDGLSDHDLLERTWVSELKPILSGDRDVATGVKRLIDLANSQNGHDNVTVGVLKLAPHKSAQETPISATVADLLTAVPPENRGSQSATQTVAVPITQNLTPQSASKQWRPLPLLLSSVLIVGLLGIAGALGWQWLQRPIVTDSDDSDEGETLSPVAPPPNSSASENTDSLAIGDYLQIKPLTDPSAAATLLVVDNPPVPDPPVAVDLPERLLPIGSIVQVISRQRTPDNQTWVRLEVCSTLVTDAEAMRPSDPPTSSLGSNESAELEGDRQIPFVQSGDQGWLLETELPVFAERLLGTSNAQQGLCTD
ncbi:protein phosphatase 2C domain-containing protein [Oscillatoria sp. CS-180]|uniref:protein phosphatase 2C domain-containing protein n=1 Tax=Oscillatoria sp. CS-180 TaxID=3021720 RepID=UPI00232AF570|nr:protein phosphatase 2C domain-containing protein [Oscillatoria sp. CS-180]MDB9525492.1 protein phosphatase 2C domain-containing protein [Oscillatoria sp. CS-180]